MKSSLMKGNMLSGGTLNIWILCRLLTLLEVLHLTACSAVSVREDGSSVRHHFGYVRVITPPTVSDSRKYQAMEYSTFGLRVENGLGIGYYHERNEYIPLDCRIVIRVMNEQQLKDVLQTLSFLKKEGLCVTVDSN